MRSHHPLTRIVVLVVLSMIPVLAMSAHAGVQLQDIIDEPQTEQYVIAEKVDCINNRVIERFVRIYELSYGTPRGTRTLRLGGPALPDGAMRTQDGRIVTKGRPVEGEENDLFYLLNNYINIEGQLPAARERLLQIIEAGLRKSENQFRPFFVGKQ